MKAAATLALVAAMFAGVAAAGDRPTFVPKLGERLPLDRAFASAAGRSAPLGDFMAGRPALLVLGYDACPNLCGVVQTTVADALAEADVPTADYRALFVSIDPSETAKDAAQAKARLEAASAPAAEQPWRFLVGPGGAALAGAAGMEYRAKPRIGEFAHPISILAIAPDGRIARALPPMSFRPRDLRLALVEASEGRIGTLADRVVLLCSAFDATRGQYSAPILSALKFGGVATLLALGVGVVLLARRRR